MVAKNSSINNDSDFYLDRERIKRTERLLPELEDRLSHLIRSLTPLKDLHTTLEEIIQHVVEIYHAQVVRLWLLVPGNNEDKVRLEGQCGEVLPGKVTELALQGIVGQIIQTKKYLYSPDVLQSPYLLDKDWAKKNKLVTHIGFPLIVAGELIGVLTIAYTHPRPFSNEEIKLLNFIADVAAIAIKNALLHEEMKQKVVLAEPEKGVIANVTRVILSSLSIKDTYSSLMAEFRRVMDFDRASIALLSKEKDVILTYVAATTHEGMALKEGQTYPLKGSVVERVSITGKPIIIEDTEKGELDTDRLLYKEGLRSRLCYPLVSKGRFIGTINFSSKKLGAYSRRHLRLLEWIAPQLATAVENSLLFEEIKEESIRDPLTRAYNRRSLFERLGEEIARSKRTGLPFGVLMCDINRFKLINDLYSHGVGDEVLKATSRILKGALREIDILYRYGGDEFVIILPDTTRTGAVEVASRLNKALFEHTTKYLPELPLHIELSTGIVIYPSDGDSVDELLSNADHAMYRAKLEPGHLFPTLEGLWEEHPVDLRSIFFNSLADAVDIKDGATHRHSQIVSNMAVTLAHELGGIPPQEIKRIREAALMHDVGKIAIPDRILNKPGKLTEEEWAIMKGHVEKGLEILKRIPETEEILPIVAATHEHYDGSGYPEGISGNDIPLGARIIAIVDAYQALVSKRPYRPAKSPEEALEIIRTSSGKGYDPKVVRTFVSLLKKGGALD